MHDGLDFPLPGPPGSLFVFHHIEKTAGTSVRATLRSVFRPEQTFNAVGGTWALVRDRVEGSLELDERGVVEAATAATLEGIRGEGVKLLVTHLHSDELDRCLEGSGRRGVCFTFLREPVARALSMLRYEKLRARQHAAGDLEAPRERGELYRYLDPRSLDEVIAEGRPAVVDLVADYQARFLAGGADKGEGLVELALARLESYAFVGLVERFDESMHLLEFTLGLPRVYRPGFRWNRTDAKIAERGDGAGLAGEVEASAGSRARLAEWTARDRELVERATPVFEAALERMEAALAAEGATPPGEALDRRFARRHAGGAREVDVELGSRLIGTGWGLPMTKKSGEVGRWTDDSGEWSVFVDVDRSRPVTLRAAAIGASPSEARGLTVEVEGEVLAPAATPEERGVEWSVALPARSERAATRLVFRIDAELLDGAPAGKGIFFHRIRLSPG